MMFAEADDTLSVDAYTHGQHSRPVLTQAVRGEVVYRCITEVRSDGGYEGVMEGVTDTTDTGSDGGRNDSGLYTAKVRVDGESAVVSMHHA
jgi:hypothetical protein